MKINRLTLRWAWTSAAAIAVFAVLATLDLKLKAHSGFGTVDLQKVATADGFTRIAGAWIARSDALPAGFNLGFDYLFMPLYGFAFYYGALIARDAFARAGIFRRLFTLLAAIPLAGAIFDAVENGLETLMLANGPTDQLAALAYAATGAKMICFFIGLALWLLGIIGLFRRKKPTAA
jgi:hypothetical protein